MGKDYYKILEIDKTAEADAIKKAYRKQALRWHPDKNQDKRVEAEERFKEIAEAYDVLSDPQKKAVYDQYGEDGLKGGPPPSPGGGPASGFYSSGEPTGAPGGFQYNFTGDPRDIFSRFFQSSFERSQSFGEGGGFGDTDVFMDYLNARGGASANVGKKPVASFELNLTLEELYRGTTKKLKIKRKTRSQVARSDEKVLEVQVTPGWKAGTKVTFAGEGDEIGNTGQFQDIVFVIREKKHPVFARDGSNLIFKAAITLKDALCGFTVEIPSLDGRTIKHPVTSVVPTGSSTVIANEGMPISKQPGRKGDLIVTFEVIFPTRLTEQQKDRLRQVL